MADVITNRIPHELSRNITHVIISDAFVATNVIIQSKADIALNIINTFNLELNQIFLSSLIISLNKVLIDKHNILWQDYTIYPCCCL